MLVLTRKRAESVKIGNDIVIKVIHTSRGTVKLGIEAPANMRVLRAELAEFTVTDDSLNSRSSIDAEAVSQVSSGILMDDECPSEFSFNLDLEVDDLMTCVGIH